MKFWFLHTCKEHFFSFSNDIKFLQICLQVQKLLITQSGYRREFHSEKLGLRKFVSHTAVLQQLQFKMPETAVKHNIWPFKVMFLKRKMPEAPNFEKKPKIDISDLQIENRCTLYCDRVSVRLISGGCRMQLSLNGHLSSLWASWCC